VKLNGLGSWKDLYKYKINAFFSFVRRQELPPAPKNIEKFPDLANPGFLFFGRAKRFLKIIFKNRDRIVSFAQSVAQSKKGAPPVPDGMVAEAEMKTFKHLTTPPTQKDDFNLFNGVWHHPINRGVMENELRRTVFEIKWSELLLDELTKPFFPSTSAQYNFGRKNLGAVASVVETTLDAFTEVPEVLIDKTIGPVRLIERFSNEYGQLGVEEQELIDKETLENGPEVKETIGLHFDDSKISEHWRTKIWPTLLEEALKEEPRALFIGLPEPVKVRVIAAGPSLTYSVLKPIQKWLWRNLKNISTFRLIGEPISEEIVLEQLGKLQDHEELISGDYVASTDNLHSWVSETLVQAIKEVLIGQGKLCPSLIDKIAILMKKSLTGHLFLDPTYLKQYRLECSQSPTFLDPSCIPRKWFKEQEEGQSMGSIDSFPFLCLANAAGCRFAKEVADNKTYKIVDHYVKGHTKCPLLINGDDCSFTGRTQESADETDFLPIFEVWESIMSFLGLSSSVGKTFRSKEFVTMNSEMYEYSERLLTREEFEALENPSREQLYKISYKLIKYVNMGLVYGQAKDGIRGKGTNRIGPLHKDLKDTCPPELYSRASEVFFQENFAAINLYKIPKFIPEWLGGLGLQPWKKSQISEAQLVVAGIIRANINNSEIKEFFKPKKLMEPREWLLHQLTRDFDKDFRFLGNHAWKRVMVDGTVRDLEQEDLNLYNSLILEVFFRYGKNVIKSSTEKLEKGCKNLRDPLYGVFKDRNGKEVSSPIILFEESFSKFHCDSRLHKDYKHNERLWDTLLNLVRGDPQFAEEWSWQKMNREDLPFQKLKSFTSCFNIRQSQLTSESDLIYDITIGKNFSKVRRNYQLSEEAYQIYKDMPPETHEDFLVDYLDRNWETGMDWIYEPGPLPSTLNKNVPYSNKGLAWEIPFEG